MKFKIYDITKKLLDINTNNIDLFKIFPDNGKHFPRFNPGLVHLSNNIYLLSYRIWIDLKAEYIYKYPEIFDDGSPWISNWSPYLKCFDYENLVSSETVQMNNYGLSIIMIEENDIKILYDQIIKIDYPYYFIEDGRLFEDKNGIIRLLFSACSLNVDVNIVFKNIKNNKTERFMVTVEIGNKNKILGEIFNDIDHLYNLSEYNDIMKLIKKEGKITHKKPNILCPFIHKNGIEKNWSVWTSNEQDYITYFTIPYGSPLIHIQVLNYNNILDWDKEINENILYNLECLKNPDYKDISLINLKNIIYENVNFFENFNFYYYYAIKFSGGSQCIRFNNSENIGIGHAVIGITKIKKNIDYYEKDNISIEYYKNKYNLNDKLSEILYYNIYNFINRPLASSNSNYIFHHNKYAYMMFYYTFNYNYPFELKKISYIFSPKFIKFNTGVVFPCGIQIVNNKVIVSYGESDNLCCIFETDIDDVKRSLIDINSIHPLEIFFYEYQFEN